MEASQRKRITWILGTGLLIGCPNEELQQLDTGDSTGIGIATALTATDSLPTGGGDAGPGGGGFDGGADTHASAGTAGEETGPKTDCDGLFATMRDFSDTHPDFQAYLGTSDGLVAVELGDDNKPRLNSDYSGQTLITSEASFSDWYNDVDGVNLAFEVELPFVEESSGEFIFDDSQFFPLDDLGFGNEGRNHNFHFTTEIHTSFTYSGGEVFTFRGDDDVWLFVDGRLVLDIGGVHGPLEETLEMDTLGLTLGQTVPMDIFHAERHTSQSNFRMVTSIECFVAPIP